MPIPPPFAAGLVERLASTWALGPVDAALYTLGRVLPGARLIAYRLLAQPVRSEPRLPAHRGRSVEVTVITPNDPEPAGLGLERGVLARRRAMGATCLVASRQGRPVGALWLALGPYDEDEVGCRFLPPPGCSWDFGLEIRPEERGSPVFARLWDEADRFLHANGISWSLSRVGITNAASLAAHRRLGAVALGRAAFLGAGGHQLMVASVPPYASVAPCPLIRLHYPSRAGA